MSQPGVARELHVNYRPDVPLGAQLSQELADHPLTQLVKSADMPLKRQVGHDVGGDFADVRRMAAHHQSHRKIRRLPK
jgi:hypothetical protein